MSFRIPGSRSDAFDEGGVYFAHMGQRLGQHFLTRPEIAGWVADALPLTKSDTVLEIGPGKGILTRELLARAGKVVAVEKDTALVAELRHSFAPDLASGRLALVEGDVSDFDPSSHASLSTAHYSLISNIPYYLTGLIIRKFLSTPHQPHSMALLVQKEVAERVVAKDGKESLLSIAVKAYGTPNMVRTVRAGSFSPPPKVDSAILAIRDISRSHFVTQKEEERFFTLLHAGFANKRKQLQKNLKGVVPDAAWGHCSIAKTARAESLRVGDWQCLAGSTD